MEQVDPIEALFTRAQANSIPMSAVCARAGVAPTTPSRWKRKRNGANLESVQKLDAALSSIIAERHAAEAA